MNWTSYKPIELQGNSYGQKDIEFNRFLDLPSLVAPTSLEVAMNVGKTRRAPRELLRHKGWQIVNPEEVCLDLDNYRRYIQTSKGEWSIAKNGYVVGQSGWFSCRSACYLAAGRPVIVQDTGFSKILPTGQGLLVFKEREEAAEAIRDVEDNYPLHADAARTIAHEYFDSNKVLTDLVDRATKTSSTSDGDLL